MGLFDFLFGSKDKLKKIDVGTQGQKDLQSQILSQLQQMMSSGGGGNLANQYHQNILQQGQNGQEGLNQFSEPYMQQFNEQVVPGIEERYAGGGALSSSGFGQALGGAASGLQGNLAQLFQQLQQQSAGQQYGQQNQMTQNALGYQPFAYQNQKGNVGLLGGLAGGIGQGIGGAASGGINSLFKQWFG